MSLFKKTGVIRVNIFETPCELDDHYLLTVFRQYGTLYSETILHQTFKNSTVYNRVRTITYLMITKPIPTVVFVQGNRIKTRHPDQDRTAYCLICKVRGHYRNETNKCPSAPKVNSKESQTTTQNQTNNQEINQNQNIQNHKTKNNITKNPTKVKKLIKMKIKTIMRQ